MYYLVTIGYETEQEGRNGDVRTKVTKEKYVIEADSVEQAVTVANNYRESDTRDSESFSVAKLNIECVISPKTTPKYYN